ncbi:DUF3795 domain-containing protein [candidate division WOR-3 bacterium]|nr:DUF3795 domain-containing protein [candidate division WOR-3 bacterium]
MDDLTGYCGLYCGACSFKVAFDEQDHSHLENLPPRLSKYAEAPPRFCPGCRNPKSLCTECGIRDCARERSLDHCGICSEFPCSRILAFAGDGLPHHADVTKNLELLKEIGEEKWLNKQRERWTCSCGAKRSWYLKKCPKCGKKFDD